MAIFKIMWNVQICPDIIDFPGPKIYKFLSWITIFLSWKCIKPGEAGSLDQSFTKRYFRLPFHTFDRLKTEKSKFKYNLCYYNQKLHNLQILHNLQMLQKQMMMVLFMMVRQYFLLRTLTLKCGRRDETVFACTRCSASHMQIIKNRLMFLKEEKIFYKMVFVFSISQFVRNRTLKLEFT